MALVLVALAALSGALLVCIAYKNWESPNRLTKIAAQYGEGVPRVFCQAARSGHEAGEEFGRCVFASLELTGDSDDLVAVSFVGPARDAKLDQSSDPCRRYGRLVLSKPRRDGTDVAGDVVPFGGAFHNKSRVLRVVTSMFAAASRVLRGCTMPPLFVRPAAVVLGEREGSTGDSEILLIKRASHMRTYPNAWVLPGGQIDPGETPREAAARELQEETGLQVDPAALELIGVWQAQVPHRLRQYLMLIFKAKIPDRVGGGREQSIVLQESEASAASWIDSGTARRLVEKSAKDIKRAQIQVFKFKSSTNGPTRSRVTIKSDAKTTTPSKQRLVSAYQSLHSMRSQLTAGHRFAIRQWFLSG